MRTNYSILETNTLDGLSEGGGVVYMRLIDKYQGNERKAFALACVFDDSCGSVLEYILVNGPIDCTPKVRSELLAFHAQRWLNNFLDKYE